MRAGRRGLWVLALLALVAAACSSPSSPSHSAPPPASAWPTKAEASDCASGSPGDWMGCLVKAHPSFADVPLSYLSLPGAENAGTFNLDAQAFDTQKGSACTTFNPAVAGSLSGAMAQRFSATQDETITRQLDGGVRWIDLKVGYNGGGNPVAGWRVTQNLYSSWPLSEYLDQVANWAALHPKEAVVVDLSTICYDHAPTSAVDKGLWANFATKSAEGAGPLTLADVAARPSSLGGSVASATLGELGHLRHNVVVLVPATAKDVQVLEKDDHVYPVRTVSPGGSANGTTEVEHSDPRVAPTSSAAFASANSDLASFPVSASPSLGALQGKGFYVSKLAYELAGASRAEQHQVVSSFVGLVAEIGNYKAWMSGLWSGEYTHILARWGAATNVVLADGVDHGGFTAAVIQRNGR